MAKPLITESTVRALLAKGRKKMEVSKGSLITPAALDLAKAQGIELVNSLSLPQGDPSNQIASTRSRADSGKVVAFGSDHGGYQYKNELRTYVEKLGFETLDLGTMSEDPCDYPDFAYSVARTVSSGKAWRGVMIDGAGIGSCIVANKVPGVKAACCHNEFVARNAREHNDTNVLTLGSRVTGIEVCKAILKVWLEGWFAGGRHKQRTDKIDEVERRFLK